MSQPFIYKHGNKESDVEMKSAWQRSRLAYWHEKGSSPRPSKRESLVDNFYIVYLWKKLSSGGLNLFSDSKEIHWGISSIQFRTVRQREKTCVMGRDFLKVPTKYRKSSQVSTFKVSSFETANTKFNISQLKIKLITFQSIANHYRIQPYLHSVKKAYLNYW